MKFDLFEDWSESKDSFWSPEQIQIISYNFEMFLIYWHRVKPRRGVSDREHVHHLRNRAAGAEPGRRRVAEGVVRRRPRLKGSIGEGSNHSNFSDRSSVRILGIQRKPRKAPSRKKPLQRSGSRPKIQEGAARKSRKGKQTALRKRGGRRSRIDSKDAS